MASKAPELSSCKRKLKGSPEASFLANGSAVDQVIGTLLVVAICLGSGTASGVLVFPFGESVDVIFLGFNSLRLGSSCFGVVVAHTDALR